MSRGWRRWQPWTVAFLGAVVLLVTLVDVAISPGTTQSVLLQASVPLLISAGVVAFGLWLHRAGFDDAELTRVATWCLGATMLFSLLGGWAFLVMRRAGVETVDAAFIVLAAAAVGAAAGAVGGLYDAMQESQRARAERASSALDATNDGVATFDDDGRVTMVNDAFVAAYGYDEPAELVGEHWERITTQETMERIESEIAEEVLKAGAWRGEVTAMRRDGSSFPVEMSVSRVGEGSTVAVARDITARREREERLARQNSLLSAHLEASRDGILILDEDWSVLEFNQRFAELWDVPPDADEADDFDILETMEARLASSASMQTRVEYLREHPQEPDSATVQANDGRIFDRYSAPVTDGETYFGRVLTFRDVTAEHRRDRTIEALHQASHQLAYADTREAVGQVAVDVARQVFSKPASGLWLYDEVDDALEPSVVSPVARERLRASGQEAPPEFGPGTPAMEAFRGDDMVVARNDSQEWDGIEGLDLGTLALLPLGDHGLLVLGEPDATDNADTDIQLVGILQQHVVAALDRVERAGELARREQRLQTIVENVPIVLFAFDRDGVFTLSEGIGLEGIGLEPGEVVGDTVEEVFAPAPDLIEHCRRALAGEYVAETADFGGRTFEAWFDPVVEDGEVRQVIGTAVDVSARARYERSIEALHSATREMMVAEDTGDIGAVVTDAARDVLSLSLSGVWLAAAGGDRLEPVSLTPEGADLIGDPPAFEAGAGLAWRAYETGETLRFDDVREQPDVHNPDTLVRSELIVPIGGYGVLISGSTVPDDFDENDVALAELLAANAEVAIARTERAAALQRQTDQFEFFNSILRHDVLNGMTVIRSRGEFLRDRLEGEERRFAETIVEWSEDIVDVVGRVRRVLEALTSEREAGLEPVDVSGIVEERIGRVADTYSQVEFSVDVPENLHVSADELLSDVLGNVITNAIEHNDPEGLSVRVEASADAEEATIRVADNGTGVDDDRKEVVFRRGETGHAKATGSGFGLFFVDAMVSRYDGAVWVEDNDAGGATIAIRLPLAEGPGE